MSEVAAGMKSCREVLAANQAIKVTRAAYVGIGIEV